MPTAKKLPSGSWRCQVFSHYEEIRQPDGTVKKKRIYKSFTSDNPSRAGKKEAELMATQYASEKKTSASTCTLTFGDALDSYIEMRSSVLSPRTIADYKRMRKTEIQQLMNVKICDITQELIQKIINEDAQKHSPKTVRNNHGLISAVLNVYRPDFVLKTDLPKKVRPDIYVPSDVEIKRLLKVASGTPMELPILLAAFGPMRRGEICALSTDRIEGTIVHVDRNMVRNADNEWVVKAPKSYAGDRYIDYPQFVADKWKNIHGRITDMHPNQLTWAFAKLLKQSELPHFRFHDLRHYSASIQHALGIPDSYIMQRGGWGNDGVLKAVYRHTMNDKSKEMSQLANAHFETLCNTICNTN